MGIILRATEFSTVLASLYLRGAPRPVQVPRASWPEALKALRRAGCDSHDAADALRQAGLWAEALVLEEDGLLDWARGRVLAGRVLTAVDGGYPARWLRVLGPAAAPALWAYGSPSGLASLSVVGSRQIEPEVAAFCTEVAREAAVLGLAVVSGRAEGCDRAAAEGAGEMVEILPHGIDLVQGERAGCLLSVCAPDEPFSSAAAMERNALIYAASSHTVIGHARFKEGGTWHGAVHAVRSRLSTLLVRRSDELAMRSLAALGGQWIDGRGCLSACLKAPAVQRALFDSAV